MLVASTVETVSAEPPNDTVAPATNPVPDTVTDVPPRVDPPVGVTELTVGAGATYVKQLAHVPLWLSRLVTTTFTAPTACAVVVPVMLVALTVVTVSAEPPSDTVAPATKPVPAMVTAVPPSVDPLLGVTEVTVGAGATYVKQLVHVPLCASGFVTTTFTRPASCAVVVPVIAVALIVAMVIADPPNDTLAPLWKPLPFTVTDVPPAAGPLFGVTEAAVGGAGATYVKQPLHVPLCVSAFVTITSTRPAA